MTRSANGQSDSWNVNTNGNWSATTNWLGGTPPGTGGVATFGDTFSFLGMSDARTITNDTNPTLSGLTLDSNFIYTVSGGASIGVGSGPFTLNVVKFNGVTPTSFGVGHIISSVLSGTTSSFDKLGSGTVTLSGTNTFVATGGININAGEVRTTVADVAFGNSANAININGGQIRSSTSVWSTLRTVTIGSNGGTLNPFSAISLNGTLSGTGRLTIRGSSGGVTIGGNSTGFSGEIQNELGTLVLSGTNSAISGNAMLDIAGGLTLTNTGVNNTNRIADNRDVTLRGALFSMSGNAAGTLENVGRLNLATGGSTISVTSTTNTSTLRFSGLARNNNSTVFFRGSTLGGSAAGNSQIEFASSPGTLIGGGGALVATNTKISILPFAAGSISATGTAPELVSWDGVSGRIYVLGSGNYAALPAAAVDDNVSVSASTAVNAGGQTINALKLTSTLNGGAADVLTVTSGTIVASGTPIINAPVNFGAAEGVLWNSASMTVNGVLSGSGGMTKGGAGILTLRGLNTYSGVTNLNSGQIVLNGTVTAGSPGAFGNDSSDIVMNSNSAASGGSATNRIWVDGGVTSTFNRGFVINAGGSSRIGLGTSGAAGDKLVINGNIQINNLNNSNSNRFLVFEGDDVEDSVTVNGIISGNGGIADAFSSFVHLNGNNNYTGGTNISGGTYVLGHDNALGTGPVWISVGTTVTAPNKIRAAGGTRTLANEFRLQSGDLAVGDNAIAGSNSFILNGSVYLGGRNNATINVGSMGTGTTINGVISGGSFVKAGTGDLTVTAANAYTGSTTVNAGSLIVNNTTGSGTGLGAVSVALGATLKGTGSMNGPVSVNGTLAPGASIESLESGALTMASGSTFQYETLDNTATGADLMKVNGALSLTGVNLDLSLANLNAGTWALGDKLTLIAYAGTAITSGFTGYADDTIYTFGANQWFFNYNDTTPGTNYATQAAGSPNFVTITAIPEPSALLTVVLSSLLLNVRRRRKVTLA
jgi:autotransporter-associated beta strand protein